MKKIFLIVTFVFLSQTKSAMATPKLSSKEFFSKLSSQSMNLVDDFYDSKVIFRDPLNELHGSNEVKKYYSSLYKNVEYIKFDFEKQVSSGNEEVLFWIMHLRAKGLNSGKEILVSGNSHIVYSAESNKCIYHRDYFDMGEFIYEQVPILKNIISFVKNRLKSQEE
jgi:hypothetical protein